ncbi:RdgB/HAM1 family non-canonical purine NTP pyrophosphatase [Balneatrix alpica]|uniref:dITP/XTP pyrophosphatase n=1 Tax=Balneatrix alpica TaxID=75684 RepID=A0ABV5ZGT1_9GAMM|nr:RdgB/HAM1 family non-canonical purine NTP pyrophosphatase [Balneatrix alpica]
MQQLVLASGNRGKLREFNQVLGGLDFEVVPQSAFSVPDAVESGLSFVENAIIKARHAARLTGLPALADDSGLEVDALKGAPGIYSARYAGEGASDEDNCALLLERMRHIPESERQARFHCVLVYMRHADDPVPLICHGAWEGRVLFEPRGEGGFGYAPLFWVPQENCSAAELTPERKNLLSHRGRALAQLLQRLEP